MTENEIKLIETLGYAQSEDCKVIKLYEPLEKGVTYHILAIPLSTSYKERLEMIGGLFVGMAEHLSKNRDMQNEGMMEGGMNPQFTFFFIGLANLLGYVFNCTSYRHQKPTGVAEFDLPELEKRAERLSFTMK